MHELALARAICDTSTRHAEGRRVSTVRLRVGTMRQVVPDTLRFYFDSVAKGTACDGSRLEIEVIGSRLRCADCGREWRPDDPSFRCPGCAGARVELLSGGELEVESIDVVEEEEAECTAPR